jgi:hypothetical protein
MKHILLFLLLFVSASASAGTDASDEQGQLEAALEGVRQEQQAVYRNYQMVRDMRLMAVQEGIPPRPQYPHGMDLNTPPPNFDEVFGMQAEREQRIRQYTEDMKNLSARYLELEAERKALIEQIQELKQQAP